MSSVARLLVTGHTGFVGKALRAWLPVSRWGQAFELVVPPAGFDIRDAGQVRSLVETAGADCILHLAAQSFVPAAFDDPAATMSVNLGGTLNLLQALGAAGFGGRLLFVSSADIYGMVPPDALPVDETRLPAPRNPYAVSKAAAEMLCRQWHFAHGLDVVVARPFNHTGEGQDPRFVLSGFARRIAQIAAGAASPRFDVGNLDVTRDFCDVRDVLAAYLSLFEAGQPGEIYNVCSGVERKLGDLLQKMLGMAGIEADIHIDPARLRPNEQLRMAGSHGKLQEHTAWQPTCDFDQTLAAMIDWWRAKERERHE